MFAPAPKDKQTFAATFCFTEPCPHTFRLTEENVNIHACHLTHTHLVLGSYQRLLDIEACSLCTRVTENKKPLPVKEGLPLSLKTSKINLHFAIRRDA